MPLIDIYQVVRDYTRDHRNAYAANTQKFGWRLAETLSRTWDLGFIAFGGPPVHFQILHQRFVESKNGKIPWLDEQTYQELFAICQALPGPGSTKMLFGIAQLHAGFLPAVIVFMLWSLPGAMGMYGLSLGIQRINDELPGEAYAFLTGLNAATVGIVALAAVQLAEKGIVDNLSRMLVIFGACAGLVYTALWYFPVLITAGGVVTVLWDLLLRGYVGRLRANMSRRQLHNQSMLGAQHQATQTAERGESSQAQQSLDLPDVRGEGIQSRVQRRQNANPVTSDEPNQSTSSSVGNHSHDLDIARSAITTRPSSQLQVGPRSETDTKTYNISIKLGIALAIAFFLSFTILLVVRGTLYDSLNSAPRPLDLFTNMYLAGTIIFGGGPVVIPLLREYVVQPGWVSSRDFLLGLAIIQAFPGPNFNFGVYLGALALLNTTYSSYTILGALLGFLGIFAPGLILSISFQSVWRVLRRNAVVVSMLRGINSTAIGLVFTAVYRLWQIGYLAPEASNGQPLAMDAWWVVVSTLSYCGCRWFKIPAPAAIVMGGVLGLCWFGVTSRS